MPAQWFHTQPTESYTLLLAQGLTMKGCVIVNTPFGKFIPPILIFSSFLSQRFYGFKYVPSLRVLNIYLC